MRSIKKLTEAVLIVTLSTTLMACDERNDDGTVAGDTEVVPPDEEQIDIIPKEEAEENAGKADGSYCVKGSESFTCVGSSNCCVSIDLSGTCWGGTEEAQTVRYDCYDNYGYLYSYNETYSLGACCTGSWRPYI